MSSTALPLISAIYFELRTLESFRVKEQDRALSLPKGTGPRLRVWFDRLCSRTPSRLADRYPKKPPSKAEALRLQYGKFRSRV